MLRDTPKTLLFSVLLLILATSAAAEIYKWTDENGHVHYSDSKPENQAAEKIVVTVNSYESVTYATAKVDVGKRVVMYSAPWCGYCKNARQYFRQKNISFTEHDIEKSAKAKRRFQKLGGQGVPVILVGRKRMNGFSEAGFERIYR